jgi:hypothetical protein
MESGLVDNPFAYKKPERYTAVEVADLYVDLLNKLDDIENEGNVIIKGPKGTGKSMVFRYMQPDCQCVKYECKLDGLKYISIYVQPRDSDIKRAELNDFENMELKYLLNEHLLVVYTAVKAFKSLSNENLFRNSDGKLAVDYYHNTLIEKLRINLSDEKYSKYKLLGTESPSEVFERASLLLDSIYHIARDYINSLVTVINGQDKPTIDFLLYNYTFLSEVLSEIPAVVGNSSASIYLLIDDAHILTVLQTKIINEWLLATGGKIYIKVSTEYPYKTYGTPTGAYISIPNDVLEVNTFERNVGQNNARYKKKIEEIVKRRLDLANIDTSPEMFFPPHAEQETEIANIRKDYMQRSKMREVDSRSASRYSIADYITRLSKDGKTATYSYAGLDQLVALSSGIVRQFIQSSSEMFYLQADVSKGKPVKSITKEIQNKVAREWSKRYLDDIKKAIDYGRYTLEDVERLENLIIGLGNIFKVHLRSEGRAERCSFSFYRPSRMSHETRRIIYMGLDLGYFQKANITGKDGTPTEVYALNKRLAPIWFLDPFNYPAYASFKEDDLISMMESRTAYKNLLTREQKEIDDVDSEINEKQRNIEDWVNP